MKILGVDPGLLNLGCVLLEVKEKKLNLIKAETIKAPPKQSLSQRLFFLYQAFKKLLKSERPEFLVVEEPIPKINPHSTAKVFQAQAIVLIIAEEESIPIRYYNPSFWKKYLCGDGKATKAEVKNFLKAFIGKEFDAKIKDEHTTDALAMALVLALDLNLL
ncbi:Holliday junction resolvase [Caldimicrobium thiodismutans]|uniref:Holliday junction resolvase n=1 Tax=Caldimicrobium thiodismutans TaxID=1653476 RepID=A0A0U5BWA0_9BACT|nr:crossover junction endodeoxyribonuclease RuvC [Caldimicrobium thiodismutans]BAU22917.1 Holliday junction resolvase [Caldimicrobium thiodismutans]